jgi:uncharacterized membrane protein YczE
MVIGLFICMVGVVLMINANIGYAPWEVFHVGLANKIGLSLGVTIILASVIIVIAVTFIGEELGLGTIFSMILPGVYIDLIYFMNIIPKLNSILFGIPMLIAGLFIMALGTYFYIKSGFGVGPRDNLMVVLARKTKMPVGLCRSIVELLVTAIGWFLGGMIGVGTVISVIGIGFCVQIIFKIFKFDATKIQHENLKETFVKIFNKG